MPNMISIYGFPPSTFVRTVRMVCAEKCVDHQLIPLEFKQPSHRKLHPFMRMPVMEFEGYTLYESLAIAIYLDESLQGPALQPKDTKERASMFKWISALSHYYFHDIVLSLIEDNEALRNRPADFDEYFSTLDTALKETAHLACDKLTLADLFAAPIIAFIDQADGGTNAINKFPALRKWTHKVCSRKSFVQASN